MQDVSESSLEENYSHKNMREIDIKTNLFQFLAVENRVSKASVDRSVGQVMIHKLTPLHQHQGVPKIIFKD